MLSHPTYLFLTGIDTSSLVIVLPILAIIGFFIWRALLKFLIKKGPRGINIAAIIMGCVQSPILLMMIGVIIYWMIASGRETRLREEQLAVDEQQLDSLDSMEIDVVSVSPDKVKVLMENEYVRVLEYTLAPGEKDNPHTHPPKSYYVVEGGVLRVYPDGEQPFDADERKGTVEWGDYVGKHYVENIGTTTVKLLVTEVKAARY